MRRFESVKSRLEAVTAHFSDRSGRRETIEQYQFDPVLCMVDVVTVHCLEYARFRFKDGTEIKATTPTDKLRR